MTELLSDDDEGIAEALRRDAQMEADPAQGISLAQLESHIQRHKANSMSGRLIDEAQLKEALTAAIIETIDERKGLVREVLEEALEDIALARAIEEGEQSKLVSRDEVFKALERNN